MWRNNFRTALSNIRGAKARSMMTMTGVIVGVTLVVTVVSLAEGLKHQVVGQVNQLGEDVLTVRSGKLLTGESNDGISLLSFLNSSTLTTRDISALKRVSSIEQITPIDFVTSNVSSDSTIVNNSFVLGTSPALPDLLHQKMSYGEFFGEEDADTNIAVIGTHVAHKLYGELNPVGHTIMISGQPFIVHGVVAPSTGGLLSIGETDFNSAVFINFDQAKSLTNGNANIVQILLRSKNKNPDKAIRDVRRTLLSTHQGNDDFTVLKQDQLVHVVNNVVNNATAFVAGLAAITLVVGGIGVMDIMLASVTERTREIGVRKAIGATNRQILNQFLIEGLVLTLTGGAIGVVLSMLVYLILKLYTNLHPVMTWPVMLIAVLVSISVGVIFSVTPALKAARKDPINALRGD